LKLNERLIAKFLPVTPGYFHTMGIPLKRGRDFAEHDKQDTERVAVIDENLAHQFWPEYPAGLDPVGQRLLVGGVNPKPATIVGIVGNVRQSLDDSVWPESVYVTFPQSPAPRSHSPELFAHRFRPWTLIRRLPPSKPWTTSWSRISARGVCC
jgi:hypothetical protein